MHVSKADCHIEGQRFTPLREQVHKKNIEGNDANRQTLSSESSYPNKAAGGVRRIHVKRSSWQCVLVLR